MMSFLYEYDLAGADMLLAQALRRMPGSAPAHRARALLLSATARHSEAVAEIDYAPRLDPLSLPLLNSAGWIHLAAGRSAEADSLARSALDLDARFPFAHSLTGAVAGREGRLAEAVPALARAAALAPDNRFIAASLAHALALAGKGDSARAVLAGLHAGPPLTPATAVAWVYDGLAQPDSSMAWLEEAYRRREGWLVFLDAWPRFERTREQPAFQELLARVGLVSPGTRRPIR